MQEMVNVYFFGKKYSVPADLTIMTAMEYAGYTLKRGCGCRHGFCGACATIYRIKGQNELKTCLACQTQVQEGMYVASIPFFPTDKRTYDIEEIRPTEQMRRSAAMMPGQRQENLRHRRDQTDRADHDGTVSGNLQLYRM